MTIRMLMALLLLWPVMAHGAVTEATGRQMTAPGKGTVRAVLVGIDLYRNVPPLHGAVADAEDLSVSLRSVGVSDITLLTNGDANRDAVIETIKSVTSRATKGDLVILGIAGHGASEPERVKGSKQSGRDEVYILAGFDTQPPGTHERIFGDEFKTLIHGLEKKGADVLFIADTCHAGGMTRDVDPRGGDITWRQVPSYTIELDDLTPISTTADALSTTFDFNRLTFLAAVDDKTKSPEIRVPGIPDKRGALSYATARAFEGAADRNSDGKVSRRELFEYVRQTVYQLTDQRQEIFSESVPTDDLDQTMVFDYDRSAAPASNTDTPAVSANAEPAVAPAPITIAFAGSAKDAMAVAALRPALTPIHPADAKSADLVFDPAKGEVVANGDVIATGIGAADLPFVADRTAALRTLKQLSGARPDTVMLTPSNAVHHEGDKVAVRVSEIQGRYLLLFDVAGDGTVQALFPGDGEGSEPMNADFSLDLSVVAPFGTDMLVAVTAPAPMPELVRFLQQNDRRRTAGTIAGKLASLLPQDARLGFTVLYTSAGATP